MQVATRLKTVSDIKLKTTEEFQDFGKGMKPRCWYIVQQTGCYILICVTLSSAELAFLETQTCSKVGKINHPPKPVLFMEGLVQFAG